MNYFILTVFLVLFEHLYFYLAKKYKITDIPNQRSSHDEATIRGGGIIIWITCLIYFFFNNLSYPYFITAISLLAVISFWDDIKNISKRVRFITHLISFCIILYDVYPFSSPLMYIIFIITGLGILNGFNFMDGINGITVTYSLVCIASFFYVEQQLFHFVDPELLLSVFISLLVFGFYNFRTKAKTFAGDVGSICIAFVFIFLQLLIFQQIHNILFLFFFWVYGVDIIYTVLLRLYMGENIFQAHRLHLFQLLKNEMGINPLLISSYYGIIQLLFNIGIFLIWRQSLYYQILYLFVSCFILVVLYIFIRKYIKFHITR